MVPLDLIGAQIKLGNVNVNSYIRIVKEVIDIKSQC